MARVMKRDLLRQRLRERDTLLPDELLDVVGNMEDAVRRVATPLLVIPGEGPVAFRARGDEDLRAGLFHRVHVVGHELLLRRFLVAHPGEGRARAPFVRAEDLVRHPRGVEDLDDRSGDLLSFVTRDTADPVQYLGVGRLYGLRRDPSASGLRRFAE